MKCNAESHPINSLPFANQGYRILAIQIKSILAIMSVLDKEGLEVLERHTQCGRVMLSLSLSVPVSVSVIMSVPVLTYVVEGLEALESRTRHGKAWDG